MPVEHVGCQCSIEDPSYYKKELAEQYQADLGEGGFETFNFGPTWKENAIDHCFTNKPEAIQKYEKQHQHYSDHKLIYVDLIAKITRKTQEKIIARDMRKIRANPQYFINALKKIDWVEMASMVDEVDEMVKFYKKSIIQSLDEVAPLKERKFKPKKHCLPESVQNEKRKRDDLHRILQHL